jgi:hypothetical protein
MSMTVQWAREAAEAMDQEHQFSYYHYLFLTVTLLLPLLAAKLWPRKSRQEPCRLPHAAPLGRAPSRGGVIA